MAGKEPQQKKPGDFLFAAEINAIHDRLNRLEGITGSGQIEMFTGAGKKAFGLSRDIPDIALFEIYENFPAYGCGRAARLVFDPLHPDEPELFGYDKYHPEIKLNDEVDDEGTPFFLQRDEARFVRGHKDHYKEIVYDVFGQPGWKYDRRLGIRYDYTHDDRFLLLPTFCPDWCYLTQVGELTLTGAGAEKANWQIEASSNKNLFQIHDINSIDTLKISRAINCIFFLTVRATRNTDLLNPGSVGISIKSDWEHTDDFGSGSDIFSSGLLVFHGSGNPPANCDGINTGACQEITIFGLIQNRLDNQHLFIEAQRASGSSNYSIDGMRLYVKQLFCPHFPLAKKGTNIMHRDEGGYTEPNEKFEGNFNEDFDPDFPTENTPEHNAGYPLDETPPPEYPGNDSGRSNYTELGP